MGKELTQDQLKELYLPSDSEFTFVDVPELPFVMIDGTGDPNGETGNHAIRWLFSVVHPIKLIAKERMGKRFVEPPLESLFWADDISDLIAGQKNKLKWRMMIILPEWATEAMLEEGIVYASKRLGDAPDGIRIERYHEGRSVQIMHVGPPTSLKKLCDRLYNKFLPENDLEPRGHHHEVFLTDPRRVAPEKMKTVVRQPVCSTA